jgi:hypothetical protein
MSTSNEFKSIEELAKVFAEVQPMNVSCEFWDVKIEDEKIVKCSNKECSWNDEDIFTGCRKFILFKCESVCKDYK